MRTSTTIILASLVASVTMAAGVSRAEALLIPKDMVYVGHGRSVMEIDKEQPADLGKRLTPYERWMKTLWSAEALNDEGPAHVVFLDSYLINTYEVSNKDYRDFIRAANHPASAYWDDPRLNKPDQPVVGVNWYDAKTYCEYRGKRLPTESEWEKAARGPKGNLFPWGNEFDSAKANYGKNRDTTMPVDAYPDGISYYGVYNMAGKVFERVSDWYDPRFYGRLDTMVNPTGPAKPIWMGGTGTYVDRLTVGEKRVIRGGSRIAPEATVRATHRFRSHPLNNSYGAGLGFRCAKNGPFVVEQQVRNAYITALKEMGREQFTEVQQAVDRGLAIDPKSVELLELKPLIEQSMKRS